MGKFIEAEPSLREDNTPLPASAWKWLWTRDSWRPSCSTWTDGLSTNDLDYKQLPLKCSLCHAYGYFAKHCPHTTTSPPNCPLQPSNLTPQNGNPEVRTTQQEGQIPFRTMNSKKKQHAQPQNPKEVKTAPSSRN